MTFYEINNILNRLLTLPDRESAVDTETGEVFDAEAINNLNIALDEKIEGCGIFVKSCDAEITARKGEIDLQKKEIARLERMRDRTIELVKAFGNITKDRPFKSTRVSWKWKTNPAHLEIETGLTYKDFPVEYIREKEPEIDKAAIKAALKEGKEIKGAWLQKDEVLAYK